MTSRPQSRVESPRRLPGFVLPGELEAALALAERPGWEAGRQGTGYDKLPLAAGSLPASLLPLWERTLAALGDPPEAVRDLFLLRYAVGAYLPAHVDPPLLDGALHRRLNALLVAPVRGGVLALDGVEVPLAVGDALCFRPDRHRHALSAIGEGARLVWSAGCNLPA